MLFGFLQNDREVNNRALFVDRVAKNGACKASNGKQSSVTFVDSITKNETSKCQLFRVEVREPPTKCSKSFHESRRISQRRLFKDTRMIDCANVEKIYFLSKKTQEKTMVSIENDDLRNRVKISKKHLLEHKITIFYQKFLHTSNPFYRISYNFFLELKTPPEIKTPKL